MSGLPVNALGFANFFVTNDAEERICLQEYLGQRLSRTNWPDSSSCGRSSTCSTRWFSCCWAHQASQLTKVRRRPNSTPFIGACGRARSPREQRNENPLRAASLGTACTEYVVSTIQRGIENRLRSACMLVMYAPAFGGRSTTLTRPGQCMKA